MGHFDTIVQLVLNLNLRMYASHCTIESPEESVYVIHENLLCLIKTDYYKF